MNERKKKLNTRSTERERERGKKRISHQQAASFFSILTHENGKKTDLKIRIKNKRNTNERFKR